MRLFQNKNLYRTFFPLLIVISLQQLAALMVVEKFEKDVLENDELLEKKDILFE